MFVYPGSLARAGIAGRERTPTVLYGAGLIAALAVVVIATRIARRALAQRTASAA